MKGNWVITNVTYFTPDLQQHFRIILATQLKEYVDKIRVKLSTFHPL